MGNDINYPIGRKTRRNVLKTLGAATAFGAATGTVSAGDGSEDDFPPTGITSWPEEDGEVWTAELGDGEITTFSSVTPEGVPKFLGLYLSPGALTNLPSAQELEESGEGTYVHGVMAKTIDIPFPDEAPEPFEYLGFGWNPNGHGPKGIYDIPHFDVHFHFEDVATVDTIEAGTADYEVPPERIPEGYVRAPNPKTGEIDVIEDMGEHMIDPTSPELNGETFTNTLLMGAADFDGDGTGRHHFVEPMVTTDYLTSMTGEDQRPVAHPEVYPHDGWYPKTYTVRDLGSAGMAITLDNFVKRDA